MVVPYLSQRSINHGVRSWQIGALGGRGIIAVSFASVSGNIDAFLPYRGLATSNSGSAVHLGFVRK
jgi:hypothetical protein